jgi:hypothetical protein
MQMFGLHKAIYKLNRVVAPEENFDSAILFLKEQLDTWLKLKSYNVPDKEIAQTVGIADPPTIAIANSLKPMDLRV